MFKLKPGNVFQKINKMDKKQAYTWGAIIIVCFIALITLASFMGDADETSFDSFNTRGYDLAQMPFVNDEAEEYLLASKYPDMQGNNASMLYSSSEKKARQEEDAQQEEGATVEVVEESSSEEGVSSGYGGYSGGYGGGGGSAAPTQVGQLGNASVSHASGSGVNTSWGAPRGDFSPYKSQEKGEEAPVQFKNQDARRALSQFAQTSRAAAGFRDAKGANAKRALMGGNVQGSEAFAEGAVDLSKSGGLALDTNAPVSSADLSNLGQDLADAADDAQDDKDDAEDDFEETMGDRLLEQLYSGLIDLGMQGLGSLLDQGLNTMQGNIAGRKAFNDSLSEASHSLANETLGDANKDYLVEQFGEDNVKKWMEQYPNGKVWQAYADLSTGKMGSSQLSSVTPSSPGAPPEMRDYISSSDSGSNNGGEIVLGKQQQQQYYQDIAAYNEQARAYREYQNASSKEQSKIRKANAKANSATQKEGIEAFTSAYEQNAKDTKNDVYTAAVQRRDAAKNKYTPRSSNTFDFGNKRDSNVKAGDGSSTRESARNSNVKENDTLLDAGNYHTQTQWKKAVDEKYPNLSKSEKEKLYKQWPK